MTPNPVSCVPEDNIVRAAMLMKQHDVGSIPVVSDRETMRLTGIVTDRDIALRVVAEQRDYYNTRVSDMMSEDMVTCREDDDYDDVVKAMRKKQIRRIPVVDHNERLLGIIAQADVARTGESQSVSRALAAISEPASDGAGLAGGITKTGMLVAGGLGLGAGLLYLLKPRTSNRWD